MGLISRVSSRTYRRKFNSQKKNVPARTYSSASPSDMNTEPFLDFLGPESPKNTDLINFDLDNLNDFGADFDKIVDDVLSNDTRSTNSPNSSSGDSGKESNNFSNSPCLSPIQHNTQRKILTPVRKFTDNLDLKKGTLHNITLLLQQNYNQNVVSNTSNFIKVVDSLNVVQATPIQPIQPVNNVMVLDNMQTISANPGQTLYITNGNGTMQQVQVPSQLASPQLQNLKQVTIPTIGQTQVITTTSPTLPTYQVVNTVQDHVSVKIEPYVSENDSQLQAKRSKIDEDIIEIDPVEKPVMAIEKIHITEEELQLLKQECNDISEFYNAVEL